MNATTTAYGTAYHYGTAYRLARLAGAIERHSLPLEVAYTFTLLDTLSGPEQRPVDLNTMQYATVLPPDQTLYLLGILTVRGLVTRHEGPGATPTLSWTINEL